MLIAINAVQPEGLIPPEHQYRYIHRVLSELRTIQADARFVIIADEDSENPFGGWDRVAPGRGGGMGLFRSGGDPVGAAAAKAGADVLLSPLHAPASPSIPQVLYALDLAPWETGIDASATRPEPPSRNLRRICAEAQAILVSSEYLRRRCLELLDIPLNKVQVAPAGVDASFEEPNDTFVELPYIVLHMDPLVAPLLPRLREALKQLEDEVPHTVVVFGMGLPEEPEDWGPRVVRIERLPNNQLAGLHQNASAFLYAGLHDGCGLRVLEAMRAGVPVVAAKSGALVDLAKDIPIYFNPANTGSMLQSIRRALALETRERNGRIRLGRSQVSRLDWEQTAWKFLSAFKPR